MIAVDRVLGGMLAVFGGILLFVLIPNHVSGRPGEPVDPSLFPRIAGWMLLSLGVLQMVFAGGATWLPQRRDLGRLAVVIGLLVAAAVLLPIAGFIPTAICLMAATILLVHERRPLWASISILGLPLMVWALFEVVLQRPLP